MGYALKVAGRNYETLKDNNLADLFPKVLARKSAVFKDANKAQN